MFDFRHFFNFNTLFQFLHFFSFNTFDALFETVGWMFATKLVNLSNQIGIEFFSSFPKRKFRLNLDKLIFVLIVNAKTLDQSKAIYLKLKITRKKHSTELVIEVR